jgi:glucokinase
VDVKKEIVPIGRPSLLRHTNALTILKLLRESGSCSRADLVRASGLSAPTVTNVVNSLLGAGLVNALGEGESSGGRPPDMLSFNAGRDCLIAVQITAGSILFLLTDLSGLELERVEVSVAGRKTTPNAITKLIGAEARRLLKKQKMSADRLLAMVVGVPAITNVDEGIVLSISTLDGWRSVPLRALLTKATGCCVIVENDTNLTALGERFRGAAAGEETFVAIHIGANVSAGIVLEGRIHRGAQWSAGEIAYLRLPGISRRQPSLYEFGELESVVTNAGIVKGWIDGAKQAGKSIDAQAVLDLAEAGDARAEKIVQQRAVIISDIILNLALILNPGLILLGGGVGAHPAMLRFVLDQLKQCEFAIPRIAAASLGESGVLWGGIAVALAAVPELLIPQPASL